MLKPLLRLWAFLKTWLLQPRPEIPESSDRRLTAVSKPEELRDLQREILAGRPFSLAEAIGREGGNFLKGECLVPKPLRAIAEINLFIDQHLCDQLGALQQVLQAWVKTDICISQHFEAPLEALEKILASILESPYTFNEFSRQVNAQWGKLYDEIPHFQLLGQPPHPETAYPHALLRQRLAELQAALRA